MTLTHAALGTGSLLKKTLLVIAGTIFIALAAQVAIPFIPVPLTLQTFAILIVGLTFGARLGAVTLLTYLAEGAAGLPVFANGGAGLAYMMGPTAGFLLGFVLMAYLAGLAVDKGIAKGFFSTAAVAIGVSIILYIPGVAWPMFVAEIAGASGTWVGSSASSIWTYWVSPFLLGDALKAVLAALVITGGWAALRSRKA